MGSRVGADRQKKFVEVDGKPVLAYTAEIFQKHPEVGAIEIVCHKSWRGYLERMIVKYGLTKVRWIADGGETFQDSVLNGVNNLKDKIALDDIVLIQYGAAPFTSERIVTDVIRVAREKGSAVTATPCYQLMGTNDPNGVSLNWVDRDKFVQLACPYGFRYSYLLEIYRRAEEKGLLATVEPHTTSLMYALGEPIHLAYGDQTNVKITTPEDYRFFEGLVSSEEESF